MPSTPSTRFPPDRPKAGIGNRSLGWDLLPPGSERFEFEGKIYAGYKDVANFRDKGTEPKPVPWYAGRQYDADTAHAKAVLKNIETFSRNANGVRAINDSPAFAPTPLALGLNVETPHSWPREVYHETGERFGRAMTELLGPTQ